MIDFTSEESKKRFGKNFEAKLQQGAQADEGRFSEKISVCKNFKLYILHSPNGSWRGSEVSSTKNLLHRRPIQLENRFRGFQRLFLERALLGSYENLGPEFRNDRLFFL